MNMTLRPSSNPNPSTTKQLQTKTHESKRLLGSIILLPKPSSSFFYFWLQVLSSLGRRKRYQRPFNSCVWIQCTLKVKAKPITLNSTHQPITVGFIYLPLNVCLHASSPSLFLQCRCYDILRRKETRTGRSSMEIEGRELEASKARERRAPAKGYRHRRCQWEESSREIEQGDKQGDWEIGSSKLQRHERGGRGREEMRTGAAGGKRRATWEEMSSEDSKRKMIGKGAAAMPLLDECLNCLKSPQQFSHLDIGIHMSGSGRV
ncbi:hypothetical protein ACLOJK_022089 [Asimina triloba]